MLSKEIEKSLNDQMNFEMYSANIYMGMAAYMDSLSLAGFSNWLKVQYQEEIFHFTKFYDFINQRGGRVTLQAMAAPPESWDSPKAAFEDALAHEQIVTGRINDILVQATETRDYATSQFLQWFVAEQVEEEDNANSVIQKLELVDGDPGGMFALDQELGTRVIGTEASGGV